MHGVLQDITTLEPNSTGSTENIPCLSSGVMYMLCIKEFR
jgi:hypothetical protein